MTVLRTGLQERVGGRRSDDVRSEEKRRKKNQNGGEAALLREFGLDRQFVSLNRRRKFGDSFLLVFT